MFACPTYSVDMHLHHNFARWFQPCWQCTIEKECMYWECAILLTMTMKTNYVTGDVWWWIITMHACALQSMYGSFSIPRAKFQRREMQQTDCAEGLMLEHPQYKNSKACKSTVTTSLGAAEGWQISEPVAVVVRTTREWRATNYLSRGRYVQQNLTRSTSDSTCIPCTGKHSKRHFLGGR